MPPEMRLVPVVDGFRAHLDAASHLGFPLDPRLRPSALPPQAQCAAGRVVSAGASLAPLRLDALARLNETAVRLRPVSVKINRALMPPTVWRIAGGVNTVFVAVLLSAVGHPDVALPCRFVYGFPIVGEVPDSHVYRSIDPTSPLQHLSAYRDFNTSRWWWNRAVHARFAARAFATGEGAASDLAVERATEKELRAGCPATTSASCRRSSTSTGTPS
jgi:hypothetical protein